LYTGTTTEISIGGVRCSIRRFYNAGRHRARSGVESPISSKPADLASSALRAGRADLVALAVVWIASAVYVWPFIDRGWIPHDEGTLAQSADRVLQGEMPHRDFDEGYTGGQAYLHAAAFRLLGIRLTTTRTVLFAAFLAFLPIPYAIARRVCSPPWAGLVAVACVAWSVPNYFAAMPSWYNLFLAGAGALALLRHVETGRRRWLVVAGLLAGLSVVVKIVGLCFVAAVLLFLGYRERELSREGGGEEGEEGSASSIAYALLVTAGGACFVGWLALVFRSRSAPMDLLHFVAPGAALAAVVVAAEWGPRRGRGTLGSRLTRIGRLVLPFAIGAAVPLAVFVLPYVATGSVGALVEGVVGRPQRQVATARSSFPPFSTLAWALPYAAVLLLPRAPRLGRRALVVLAAAGSILLAATLYWTAAPDGYLAVWHSARSLDAVAVLAGALLLARVGGGMTPSDRQKLFLVLAVAALVSLVQFPFSAPIYFCYCAPLVALALAYLARSGPPSLLPVHAAALLFYGAFAVLRMNPGYVFRLGWAPGGYVADARLGLERGGLRVPARDALVYGELARTVAANARGPWIYAGPDAPEVYFLCERKNPGRVFFEHLAAPRPDPPAILRMLEERGIDLVVWNRTPDFSPSLGRDLGPLLAARYPRSREIGKFTVMWRER
jgi:hypothetical protein